MFILLNDEHELNAEAYTAVAFGNIADFNFIQFANALIPIVVQAGKEIDCNSEQLINALEPIDVQFGAVTILRLKHLENASAKIVSHNGRSMLVIPQEANASDPIVLHFCK
jgi:hypothetical protein